jgi:hypothetical protein
MHLQHVSRRRVVAKQALYRMTEMLRWGKSAGEVNARYGPATDETGMRLARVPLGWWDDEKNAVQADAEPWQEREVARLIAVHGRERFAGVDLGL